MRVTSSRGGVALLVEIATIHVEYGLSKVLQLIIERALPYSGSSSR